MAFLQRCSSSSQSSNHTKNKTSSHERVNHTREEMATKKLKGQKVDLALFNGPVKEDILSRLPSAPSGVERPYE